VHSLKFHSSLSGETNILSSTVFTQHEQEQFLLVRLFFGFPYMNGGGMSSGGLSCQLLLMIPHIWDIVVEEWNDKPSSTEPFYPHLSG
jgi:hypothetical protein